MRAISSVGCTAHAVLLATVLFRRHTNTGRESCSNRAHSMMEFARAIDDRVTHGFAWPLFVLMLALILGPRLAKRARLPTTVGLVLVGMVLGPHCTRLLKGNEIALQAWGMFGLLYLMFSAALELNVRVLAQMKRIAITFALLSFAIPFSLGIASARFLEFGWAAAILMGSNWGSHTVLTYPMLRAAGLGQNRAVAMVVGATALTDTSALLVLTVVSIGAHGSIDLGAAGATLAVGLALLAVWTLLVLPRIARWFFSNVGDERSHRLVFGMMGFLSGAVLAEAASISGIVGAFFAGMGMARVIPARSPLMDRVQFFGSSLFIPTFLVSVGVLLEPQALLVPKTLSVAIVFAAVVLGGKTLAAVIAGRMFHFTWPEVGVMSGLSGSQAAATLATTLVGVNLGIFDTSTFNAVLIVVLVTLIVTPLIVSHCAKRVVRTVASEVALGASVLVLVRDEETRSLLSAAAQLAMADSGIVVVMSLATDESSASELATQRHLAEDAERWLAEDGFEARAVFRIAPSIEAGLRDTVIAEQSSPLVVEWRHLQQGEPAEDAVQIASRSPIPVLLAHGPIEPFARLLVLVRHTDLSRTNRDLAIASVVTHGLDHKRRVIYVGAPAAPLASLFGSTRHFDHVESDDPIAWLKANTSDTDLVVLPGLAAARDALERIPHFARTRFLVAIAPRDCDVDHPCFVVPRSVDASGAGR